MLLDFCFFAFLIYSWLYQKLSDRHHYDYVIIHGSGLIDGQYVTPLLKGRADKAIEAYQKMPGSKIIASGGQGADEK